MNAVGACGLQLYNFGQTVSLVFFTETWKPDSFYDRVKENADLGMHTLVLLDIKVKEQSEENLARSVTHLLPSHLHCKAHLYHDQGEKNIHRGHWAPMQSAKGWKHSGGIAHVSRLFAFSKSERKFEMFLHIMHAAKRVKHSK